MAGHGSAAELRVGLGYVWDSLNEMSWAVHDILVKDYSFSSQPEERLVDFDLLINKLDSIHKTTVPLRRHRNNLARIHILPDEMLITIFRYWRDEHIMECEGHPMKKHLRLSWVCQHWRNLIINNPIFWVHIDDELPAHALQEVMQRSKNAGLYVKLYARVQHPEEKKVADLICKEAHRIETLQARWVSPSLWRNILDNLEVITPRLRYISATCRNMTIELKSCPGTTIDLKQFTLALESPTPWGAFNRKAIMSTIQELNFFEKTGLDDLNIFNPDLNQCSRLQVLDILVETRRGRANPFENLKFANLEQLHTLVLRRSSNLNFLDYVQLPRLRRFVCDLDPPLTSHFDRIKRHFPFSQIRHLGVGSHGIDDDDEDGLWPLKIDGTSEGPDNALTCCRTSFAHYECLSPEHQSNSHFQFCFKFEGTDINNSNDLFVILDNILREAPNANKIVFRNFGEIRYDCDDFEGFFTNRRCISLALQGIENIPNILGKLCDNNVCCGLEELALSSGSSTMKNIAFGEGILRLAQARQEKGSPIKRIHFKHSPFFSEHVSMGLTILGIELVETSMNTMTTCIFQCHCPCFGCLQEKSPHRWLPEEVDDFTD